MKPCSYKCASSGGLRQHQGFEQVNAPKEQRQGSITRWFCCDVMFFVCLCVVFFLLCKAPETSGALAASSGPGHRGVALQHPFAASLFYFIFIFLTQNTRWESKAVVGFTQSKPPQEGGGRLKKKHTKLIIY